MNRIVLILAGLFSTFMVYGQSTIKPAATGVTYGKVMKNGKLLELADLHKVLSHDSVFQGRVTGVVKEVCKKKGCFMALADGANDPVMVHFTNYGFFMPPNIVGKKVTINGIAKVKTTSVEQLQHFAMDAGKSKDEIEKITQPKKEIKITADGVLVVN